MKIFFTARIRELSVMLVVVLRRASDKAMAAVYCGTTVMTRASRPRGSPFPLPAGLADGLGLRSGLGDGCPPPCAPAALRVQRGVWVPRTALRERRTVSAAELSVGEKYNSAAAVNRLWDPCRATGLVAVTLPKFVIAARHPTCAGGTKPLAPAAKGFYVAR